MKSLALLPVFLLLSACASSTAMEPDQVYDCGPGHEIEIQAGLEGARQNIDPGQELAYLVEVANNSHQDIVVEQIRIEPNARGRGTSELDPVYQSVQQEIPEGKDHLFRFPVRMRLNRTMTSETTLSSAPEMTVTVLLKNGDAYRCSFSLAR